MTKEPVHKLSSRLQQIIAQDQIDTGSERDREFNIETVTFPFSVTAKVTFGKEVVEKTAQPNSRDTRTEALAKLDRTFHDRINGDWLESYISDHTPDGKFEQFKQPFSASHSRTCQSCNGARKLRCRSCGGRRFVRCTSCSSGYVTCTNCDGSGMLRCISCGGSGRKEYSENVPYRGVGGQTFYRLETRTRSCSGCGGNGRSMYCACQYGKRICTSCDGRSEVRCGGCSGTGENVCSTCQGAGKEGFNITYTPVIDEKAQLVCEHDQSTFDRYMREVPGFLEQKTALQRQNLKYRSEGAKGQYRYNAVTHAARASSNGADPGLILGHESMEPYRSPEYLDRVSARTVQLLKDDALADLKAYPLGQACLDAIRNRPPFNLGDMSKFDPGQQLTDLAAQARKRLALKLTEGESRSIAILSMLAFAALLLVLLIPTSGSISSLLAKVYFGVPIYGAWVAWFLQSKNRREKRSQRALEAIGEEVDIGTGVLKASAASLAAAQALAFVVAAQVKGSQVCRLEKGIWDNAVCGISEYLFGLTLLFQ